MAWGLKGPELLIYHYTGKPVYVVANKLPIKSVPSWQICFSFGVNIIVLYGEKKTVQEKLIPSRGAVYGTGDEYISIIII